MAYIKSSFGSNVNGILGNSGDYIGQGITGVSIGIHNGNSLTIASGGLLVWNITNFTNLRTTVDVNIQMSTDGETFTSVTCRGNTNDITNYKYLLLAPSSSITFTLS